MADDTLKLIIESQKEEIRTLKDIVEHNAKIVENRGRKMKYDEPLDEMVCFTVTKTQKKTLKEICEAKGIEQSTHCRQQVFGE